MANRKAVWRGHILKNFIFVFVGLILLLLYQACGSSFEGQVTSPSATLNFADGCNHPDSIDYKTHIQPILSNCVGCHGSQSPAGGLDLLKFESESFAKNNMDTFFKIVTRVESQSVPMPPTPMTRLEKCEILALKKWSGLGGGKCTNQSSSPVTLRRFNSKEYKQALKDLLGLQMLPDVRLPVDSAGPDGFKTHGEYQLFTPDLAQSLLEFSGAAIQFGFQQQTSSFFRCNSGTTGSIILKSEPYVYLYENGNSIKPVIKAQDQASWLVFEVPKAVFKSNFNEILVKLSGVQAGGIWPSFKLNINDSTVASDVTVNAASDQVLSFSYNFSADQSYKIGISFENPHPTKSRKLNVSSVEFRRSEGKNLTCIESKLREITEKAYGRPLSNSEFGSHLAIASEALSKGLSYEEAFEMSVQSVLLSPYFLYHVVEMAAPDNPSYMHDLSDFELATRLAAFIWGSVPDGELLELAKSGRLQNPVTLAVQTRRMLTDPKGQRFARNFSGQWLHTDSIFDLNKADRVIANFDQDLKESMKEETDQFFMDLVSNNRDPMLILNADYTFVNENLAQLYNLPGVSGNDFQKISLSGADGRKGVLTQASLLAVTSGEAETSPIKRGHFVLTHVLCDSPPAPPDNVGDLIDSDEGELSNLSIRQQITQHRADPKCASCHYSMDPIGFGLEHFDPVGQFRTRYSSNNFAVEAYGDLPNLGSFDDHQGLLKILGSKGSHQFKKCLTEKVFSFGVGRPLVAGDKCEVERIANEIGPDQGIVDLIVKVVTSPRFRTQQGGSQ